MSRDEQGGIALHESSPTSHIGDQTAHDTEQDAVSNSNQAADDARVIASTRKRACVLVGSALSQLPIWGKLT